VNEFIESIPLIRKDYILLVQSLLNIRWIKRSVDIVQLFHKFIFELITSKSEFLTLCLVKIVKCFVPEGEFH